jgi:hypothetical protein
LISSRLEAAGGRAFFPETQYRLGALKHRPCAPSRTYFPHEKKRWS